MVEVILTRGLPGSGKSTWAREMLADNPGAYKRVNKDDLRAMLHNGKHSKNNEQFVERVRDSIILEAIEDGKHVIIDDTNFAPRHEARIRQLVKGKATVRIEDFTDVTVEECIKRDLARTNSVGEKVIRDMWRQFLAPAPAKPEFDPSLPNAIIVDLDGTYALIGDRSPYDAARAEVDELNTVVHSIVSAYKSDPTRCVILCSGRQSEHRAATERWLAKHDIAYDALFMRAEGDVRKDNIVKREIFENNIRGNWNIEFVLDDRSQVVDMWRNELGLTCLQVAEGDF
jgi:predicted kinase